MIIRLRILQQIRPQWKTSETDEIKIVIIIEANLNLTSNN